MTAVIAEYEDHPQGYGLLSPPTDQDVWKVIYETIPEDKEYLKHFVVQGWEKYDDDRYYVPSFGGLKIPTGVLVYYVNIYVQTRSQNSIL